jgi:hypothetical protein
MTANAFNEERRIELRPQAVLAIGVTGHRNIDAENENSAISATLEKLFVNLGRALSIVVEKEAAFFSKTEPALRTVCMAAEGADLLCAQAARAAGSAVVCVLPFPFEEYQKDFSSPATVAAARAIVESANARFVLPGNRDEGPRAYERANEIILANVDLLIAVWNGNWPAGRAGTAEVVQSAISRRIPVIVVAPSAPAIPQLIVAPGDAELVRPVAVDLPRRPLETDLGGLVSQMLSPPFEAESRRGLIELLDEKTSYRSMRFEYPLLLKLFGVASEKLVVPIASPVYTFLGNSLPSNLPRISSQIDFLASHYARLYRSSAVSEIVLTIVAALLSAVALIFFPLIAGASVVVQVAVNGLVLVDSMTRARRRWQERWLDYRVVAERLRCVRFLHPLALGLLDPPIPFRRHDVSWTRWFVHRHERVLDPPSGMIGVADVEGFAQKLADLEIPEQLKYHHSTLRQLWVLDRRLSVATKIALAAAIGVAVLFGFSAYRDGGIDHVRWKPLAVAGLLVLPTIATAFSGIRANADLTRLVERSAMMATALTNLQLVIRSTTMNYDRVAVAAARFANFMGDELSEWRFVIESRRIRTDSKRKNQL